MQTADGRELSQGCCLTSDANGNLTNDGNGKTYTFDAANRMVSCTQTVNGVQTVTGYVYDGWGQRVQETSNGVLVKQWVWCGGTHPCEERDASNNVTKRFYSRGAQINGVNYYYAKDHLGSIRELTDSTGAIRARYDYDPYGRQTKVSGDLDADFGFCGYYNDLASGGWATENRILRSDLARWTTPDPSGEAGGINLYDYVGNNPVNAVDPLGLWSSIDWPVAGFHPVHQIAIDHALSFLSASDRTILKNQQPIADQDQAPRDAYMHAMRDGIDNQTVDEARNFANQYVRNKLNFARELEGHHCHEKAMEQLGLAIHTLQDSTSPAHEGFQPWGGSQGQNALSHVMMERSYPGDNSSLFRITRQAYNYFNGSTPMPSNFFR